MIGAMRIPVAILTAVVLLCVNARSDEPDVATHKITPEDRHYAEAAAALQRKGLSFDQIFAELCKTALTNADSNPKLPLEDQCRSLFGGLWLWARNGGRPSLQSRNDWAQHFIGGGAFEGYWDAGRTAAIMKERMDSRQSDNVFDLDDMAATMLGARWMDLAVSAEPGQGRRWVELWASGRYTITQSLPKLKYGQIPKGQVASKEAIKTVETEVDAALGLPDEKH